MIVIIGAGISGLTLAYELQKANKPYILLESSSRPGGYIYSQQIDDYLIEAGPNSILIDDTLDQFIAELGLKDDVEDAAAVNKHRFVYKNGQIKQLPAGPASLLFSNFFSLKTKKIIFREFGNKSRTMENESVYDFFVRHFSEELTTYTVDPFATGIYAGDIKQLLIEDTFPQLVALEKEYGSILKGVFKKGMGARRRTATFTDGLQTLTDTLASKLHSLSFQTKALSLFKTNSGIEVNIQRADSDTEIISADKVVFCSTAFHAAEVLTSSFPGIAAKLHDVRYAPMKALYAAFKRSDVKHHMRGFGCLYPSIEKSFLAGTIWNSSIFKYRCPEDEVLTTSFIGGMHHPEYTALSDNEIQLYAIKQLREDLGITGEPTFVHVTGWKKAIPQYDIFLKEARKSITGLQKQHIYFSSNWTHAISLGSCIQNARDLALGL
jgi:oxygen-dependent protoporphyrinogen oxidase